MAACLVPGCEEDGIYCDVCCDSCYCHIHKDKCNKRICQLCNGPFDGTTGKYCETCDTLDESSYLKCPFQGCKSVFGVQLVSCCSTYYCQDHFKYHEWRKCCPACTSKVRCILCVKTKDCPCGYKKCKICERFFHENNLDRDGNCFMCYKSPYYFSQEAKP
jgi:hypothetical protein